VAFAETYRSSLQIPEGALSHAYESARPYASALYFLVTPDARSVMHRIRSDQRYHHYLGDPLEVLMLYPDGSGAIVTVGPDLRAGMRPQLLVPANTFHASHLLPREVGYACSPARSGPASSPRRRARTSTLWRKPTRVCAKRYARLRGDGAEYGEHARGVGEIWECPGSARPVSPIAPGPSCPGTPTSDENYSGVRVELRSSSYQVCSAGRCPSVSPARARPARRE